MAANYQALSGQDVIKKVRNTHIKYLIFCTLGVILAVVMLIAAGSMIRNGEGGILVMVFGVLVMLCSIYFAGRSFKTLGNIENCRLFRKYGTPDEIAQRISEGSLNTILDSKGSLCTDTFIMKHSDFESYVPYEDILLLYRKEHRTNGVLDGIYLVVHDRYGDKFEYPFKMGKKHAGEMDTVANAIGQRAKDCRFGYTPDNLSYVKQNAKTI